MTTIAWDGKTVAADSRASAGNMIDAHAIVKLIRSGDTIYGKLGLNALGDPLIEWYESGANPKDIPSVKEGDATLLVFRDGKCVAYNTNQPYPEEQKSPNAWGTGGWLALAALCANASPEEAVNIAAKFDSATGGAVQVIDLSWQGQAHDSGNVIGIPVGM